MASNSRVACVPMGYGPVTTWGSPLPLGGGKIPPMITYIDNKMRAATSASSPLFFLVLHTAEFEGRTSAPISIDNVTVAQVRLRRRLSLTGLLGGHKYS